MYTGKRIGCIIHAPELLVHISHRMKADKHTMAATKTEFVTRALFENVSKVFNTRFQLAC